MIGLPRGKTGSGLFGIEGVHVSHLVAGRQQDVLQLSDVWTFGSHVQLSVEREIAQHGDDLAAVDGQQGITGLDGVPVFHGHVSNLAVHRGGHHLEFVATQLAPDSDLVSQRPDRHRLGDGPIDPKIHHRRIVSPRLPHHDGHHTGRRYGQGKQALQALPHWSSPPSARFCSLIQPRMSPRSRSPSGPWKSSLGPSEPSASGIGSLTVQPFPRRQPTR